MRVIAIPVKPLERAKLRLASLLSPAERAVLSVAMLEDALDASLAQPGWEVWVVSRDEAVLEIAARRGALPVPEQGRSLLEAVRQAESLVRGRWSDLAVVLADLPTVTPEALSSALAHAPRRGVMAVPAESDGGTNLLLRRPPSAIPARFGRSSFARHRAEAYRRGLTFQSVRVPAIGFDLDRPEDVAAVMTHPAATRSRAVCLEMRLAERLGTGRPGGQGYLEEGARVMPQGTIKEYDIATRSGSLLMDDATEVTIDESSAEGSGHIRYLRIGQRVVFDLAEEGGRRVARSMKVISFA